MTTRAAIIEGLRHLSTPIDNIELDPANARRGDVEAIRRSLNVFGQRKPVVVKRTGTDADGTPAGIVIAGNHTVLAARDLGWTHVAAVFVDDDASTAAAYALADNRTGELATWDQDQLVQTLQALSADERVDMSALGWTNGQLASLLGADEFEPDPAGEDGRLDQQQPSQCPSCGFEWRTGPAGEVTPA
jgi:ParB-like chromosome segregation protein Spo0J